MPSLNTSQDIGTFLASSNKVAAREVLGVDADGILDLLKGDDELQNSVGQYIIGEEFLPDILPVSGLTFPDASNVALPSNSVSTDSTRGLYVHDGIMTGGYPVGGRSIYGAKTIPTAVATTTHIVTSIASCKIMPQEITTASRWFISGDVIVHGLNLLTANGGSPVVLFGVRITNLTDNIVLLNQFSSLIAPTMDSVTSNINLVYSGDIISDLFDINYLSIAWNNIAYAYSANTQTVSQPTITSTKGTTNAYPADGLLIDFYVSYARNSNSAALLSAACDLKVIHT